MSEELKKRQKQLKEFILELNRADVQAGHLSFLINNLAKRCLEFSLTDGDPDDFYESEEYNEWCDGVEEALDDLIYKLYYFARYTKCIGG